MRFPLPQGAGSDAVHSGSEYAFATTPLASSSGLYGTGIVLTLGPGNQLVCCAPMMRGMWYARGRILAEVDFSLFKIFPITEGTKLEFRFEAFNLTNTPVLAIPDQNNSDASFAKVSSTANTARQLQFGLKLYF